MASGVCEAVRARVDEYGRRNSLCPILYLPGDPKLMIDTFAQQEVKP